MRKIWLSSIVFVLMAGLIAGCGGGKNAANTQASEPNKDNAEKQITLNYMSWGPHDESIFAKWNEKYPNVKINFQQINDSNQYNEVLRTRLSGGADIDIAAIRVENYREFIQQGFLEDITNQSYLKNYLDTAINDVTVDGKVYAIPMGVAAEAVWYNKDIFKQLNLNVPTTYDEFLAVCEAIKKSGLADPMTQAVKDGWAVFELALGPFHNIVAKDPDIANKLNKGEAKFTDPQFVDVFNKFADIIKKGYVQQGVTGMDWQAAGKQFATGEAAMYINGSWNSGYLNELNAPFEMGVFVMPQNDQGGTPAAALVNGLFVSIVSSSKHKEEAQRFLEFMSDKEGGATIYYDTTGQLPSVKGVAIANPISALWQPVISGPGYPSLRTQLKQGPLDALFIGLQEIITGSKTPEQVAKNVQAAQDKVLDK